MHYTEDQRQQIGKRIRALRKRQGLTQPQLGERVQCTFNSVSAYEHGVPARMTLLWKFAQALGVSLSQLTGEHDSDHDLMLVGPQPASTGLAQRMDPAFMARCIEAAEGWIGAEPAHLQVMEIACRLYEHFHARPLDSAQLRSVLEFSHEIAATTDQAAALPSGESR